MAGKFVHANTRDQLVSALKPTLNLQVVPKLSASIAHWLFLVQPFTTPSARPLKNSFCAKVNARMPGVTTIM